MVTVQDRSKHCICEGTEQMRYMNIWEEVTMFCRNCGQQNDDRAVFCVNCGKPLKKEVKKEQGNMQQNAPKKSQKTLWMWIGGIVMLLVAICVLSIVLIFAKGNARIG